MRIGFWIGMGCLALTSQLGATDWSQNATIPGEGRSNVLELAPELHSEYVKQGWRHSLQYPVEVTGVTVPMELLQNLLIDTYENPLRKLLQNAFKGLSGVKTFEDFEELAGLLPEPEDSRNIYQIDFPSDDVAQRLGTSIIDTENGSGVTFSCAA